MFKRLYIIILFFLFVFQQIKAQSFTQTLRGKVIDADSKSPLFGANIILLNSDTLIGSTTDVDGKFRLDKVPIGRQSIKITSIGYEEAVMNNIIISSAKEVVLTIELREKVYSSEAIEIVVETDKTKANNDLVTVSARNFQAEETNRYAGSRGDPSKMVSNYAGVSSGNDVRNDIIVRGNSPLGVLWRLEGVDIPNPNHFSAQGATGGPISMLNNNLLGNCDFLTGAFPAEYGNKTAAVFDLKLRNGNNEQTEFTGQIGINGVELGAEGPISKEKGSSYLVNYRYSTLEIFNKLGIHFGVSASPQYQDISYKINIPTKKAGIFTFWGIGGTSSISLLDSKQKNGDWALTSKGEDLVFLASMGATGIANTHFFNPKVSGKISLSTSGSNFLVTIDTLSVVDKSKFRTVENQSTEANFIGNYTVVAKINARHLIKSGFTYQTIYFDAKTSSYDPLYNKHIFKLNVKSSTSDLIQSFAHWQYRPTEKISINSGVHYQLYTLNNSWAIEPRLGIRYQLTKKQSLNLGYGLHSQLQPIIYYFYDSYNPINDTYSRSNDHLDLTKSRHLILGYDYNFAKNYRLKFESYYQYIYNVPVNAFRSTSFSMINVGNALDGIPLVDSLANNGDGENKGIEITLEKFFSNHFYFLTTTSIYTSTYKGSDGQTHHTSYDGGYVFNTLLGYELALDKNQNKSISLDLKYTHAGGNRYTPIDLEKSQLAKTAVYIESEAFTKKLKDYSRFDVKLSFKMNRKKTSHYLFISIENILDRKNILRQTYDADSKQVIQEYQFSRFPYGGYRVEF